MYLIISFPEFNGLVDRIVNLTKVNLDALQLDTVSWGEQFENAFNVNGGDLETATVSDYLFHLATFAWKVKIFIHSIMACVKFLILLSITNYHRNMKLIRFQLEN